jgi:hypothetical protein
MFITVINNIPRNTVYLQIVSIYFRISLSVQLKNSNIFLASLLSDRVTITLSADHPCLSVSVSMFPSHDPNILNSALRKFYLESSYLSGVRDYEFLLAIHFQSSGLWRRIDILLTDVSEERIASIFRLQ